MGWVALRVGDGMGPRIREDKGEGGRMVDWMALRVGALRGNNGGGGGGGMGSRIRLHGNNGARRGNAWWGRGSAGTTDGGMDPRIREDKGEGWVPPLFTGASSRWEDTGGCTPILTFPPEGGRERRGVVGSLRFYGGGHSAGTMWIGEGGGRDGFPHPSSWGQVLRGGTGMGPRIREDNGGGGGDGSPHPREQRGGRMGSRIHLHGGRLFAGGRGWVPASARTTGAGSSREQRRRGWGWVPALFTGASSRWEDTGVVGSLRFYGGGHSAGTMWMGERGGRDGSPHTRGQRMGEREEG